MGRSRPRSALHPHQDAFRTSCNTWQDVYRGENQERPPGPQASGCTRCRLSVPASSPACLLRNTRLCSPRTTGNPFPILPTSEGGFCFPQATPRVPLAPVSVGGYRMLVSECLLFVPRTTEILPEITSGGTLIVIILLEYFAWILK